MPFEPAAFAELEPAVKVFDGAEHALVFLRDELELRLIPKQDLVESRAVMLDELDVSTGTVPSCSRRAVGLDRSLPSDGGSGDQAATRTAGAGEDSRPSLDRLTLTVSNVCNLGCSYCYAAKGTYYNNAGLMMTAETAFAALNQAARAYSRIEHVNFFGGEPTLNREVVEIACAYVRYLHDRGDFSQMPTFGITTNGYALSEPMLQLLVDWNFSVTLSLDGPPEVHDAKRPTKSGRGSYEAVAAAARSLLARGLEVEFECTYSNEHLLHGISIVDLMDFFYEKFGCRTLHCAIVSAAPGSPEFIPLDKCLELQGDAIEASMLNLARRIPKATSVAMRMLHSLSSRTPIWNYCPAGRKEVTVNADGEVYSCFMLMQSRDYSFGSVHSAKAADGGAANSKPFRGAKRKVIEDLLSAQDKFKNEACGRCWAQPLCHGCLGEDFERTGGAILRSEIPGKSEFCDYKRGIIERFLRSVEKAQALERSPAPTM